jgi:hypothetical protein
MQASAHAPRGQTGEAAKPSGPPRRPGGHDRARVSIPSLPDPHDDAAQVHAERTCLTTATALTPASGPAADRVCCGLPAVLALRCRNWPLLGSSGAAARRRVRRSPRRALALARPSPARPRRPSQSRATDLASSFARAARYCAKPSFSLSIVPLRAAASRAPAASLRDRRSADPGPGTRSHRDSAPARKREQTSKRTRNASNGLLGRQASAAS